MTPKPGPSRARATDATPAPLPPVTRDGAAHPMDQKGEPVPRSKPEKRPGKKVTSAPVQPLQGTGAPEASPIPEEVQAVPPAERRQFNIGVPKHLKLHRRAGLYAEDHGLSRQDQVALALDAWLRERGY